MSNEQLKHIFDNSTCLTKKQMRSYVIGSMTNEEAHAVEVHLNSCPMCSDAIDGLFAQEEGGLAGLAEVNSDFLKDHFGKANPHIHLNSITATHAKRIDLTRKNEKVHHLWRTASIAAALLLLVGSIWYYRSLNTDVVNSPIAEQVTLPQQQEEITTIKPSEEQPIAMNMPAKEEKVVVERPKQEAPVAQMLSDAASLAVQKEDIKPDQVKTLAAPSVPVAASDESKTVTDRQAESPAARTENAIAATSTGGYQQKSFGNSYNADAAQPMAANASKKLSAESVTIDKLEQANKLYEAKQYGDALNLYTHEMRNAENKSHRQEATVGAARSYIALGNKTKAKEILQSIIDEGGAYKREAKRLLREIE
jgi:FimV-like protein